MKEKKYLGIKKRIMAKMELWKTPTFVLKFIITFTVLYFILKKIDFRQIKEIFLSLNTFVIISILVLSFLTLIIMTLKWRILLKRYSNIKFKKLLKICWASHFTNLFGIGGIGGEVYKTMVFKKRKQVLFSSLLDKTFSIIWSFILVITVFLSSLFFSNIFLSFFIGILLYLFFSFLFIFIFISLKTKIISKETFIFKNLKKVIVEFPDNKRDLFLHSNINLIFNLLVFAKYFILFSFVGLSFPAIQIFIFIPLLRIALLLPISIQGFGIREFMFLQLSNFTGLNLNKLIGISFLIYIFGLFFGMMGMVPFFMNNRNND